jgi:late competence protein required for DNA uptake (superfamily II DNA/RNA helicase)
MPCLSSTVGEPARAGDLQSRHESSPERISLESPAEKGGRRMRCNRCQKQFEETIFFHKKHYCEICYQIVLSEWRRFTKKYYGKEA